MQVLAIPGSVRSGSHNAQLLRAAASLSPGGVEVVVWDRLVDLPHFDEDLEAAPGAAVEALRAAARAADAVLIATPEYNHSIPGVLKNALDWLSRPTGSGVLTGKPVAVVGASTGMFGAVWAQAETRKVLGALGAHVLEDELPIPYAHEAIGEDGALDGELRGALQGVLTQLQDAATPVAA